MTHFTLPEKHARVRVTFSDPRLPPLEGTYRGRVVDAENYAFDPQGKAIWVTSMFEHFIPLDSIKSIETIG